MLRFSEIAPDINARFEAWKKHNATCTGEACDECRRYPRATVLSPEDVAAHRRAAWAKPALSTVPPAFDDARLTSPWLVRLVGEGVVARARGSLTAPRVVMLGEAGSGKTSLVVAMFRAVLDAEEPHGRAGHRYVSAHALAKARAGHPLGHGEAPLVEAAIRAPLLVLDELGGEDARHASAVTEVIYERHAAGATTWVTTGVTAKELAARYGGGVVRRVFEGATKFALTRRAS
jgi:hypothetical protein